MATGAMKLYRVRGIYYPSLVCSNCGPFGLGKQIVDEVPTDLEGIEGNHYRNPTGLTLSAARRW